MKIEATMSKELFQECIDTMKGWYGIQLTSQQMKEILHQNKELALDIIQSRLDTVSRETLTTAIAKYVGLNREWPCGYMGKKYNDDFFKEFYTSCITSGVKLDDDFLKNYIKDK